jgi:uncharacterized protein involved in outer membrane biogenesis
LRTAYGNLTAKLPRREDASRAASPTVATPHPHRWRPFAWGGGIVAGVIAAVVLVLAFMDWNMMRGPIGHYLSARMHRDVRIAGDLDVKLFSWTPRAVANDVVIGQPDWVDGKVQDHFADFERFTIAIDLRELFRWNVVLDELTIDKPDMHLLREASGRANWNFGDPKHDEPLDLPAIRHFALRDGKLALTDQVRKLEFTGTFASEEGSAQGAERIFKLNGKGALNRQPFFAEAQGDPLLEIDPDNPYNFRAQIGSGATRIEARGTLAKPFDLAGFHTVATFSGATMADLYYLTGLALPNTPPYKISGDLTRDGDQWRFAKLNGKVGDSDLRGELSVDASGERPYLKGDIASNKLDFDDLGPLIGAPPATDAGETASASQKTEAAQQRAADRVLPDAPLQTERLRQMDADVRYRADTVASRDFPLRQASLQLSLKNGVLKLDPVSFDFARGKLAGQVRIDARKDVPESDIDVRVTALRLEQFMPASKGEPPLEAEAAARAKLHGVGNSVRKAAATANGQVTVVVPHGTIRQSLAELLGINLSRALTLLLTNDQTQTELRCGVADFQAKNGVLGVRQFVFDTEVTSATGEGTVDLRSERVDLKLNGHSKKPRLVRLRAPITISGPLGHPDIGVEAGTAVVQGGLAAGLAFALSPLAAILPFVDPGLAKDANCGTLVAQAQGKGAPVSSATASTAR